MAGGQGAQPDVFRGRAIVKRITDGMAALSGGFQYGPLAPVDGTDQAHESAIQVHHGFFFLLGANRNTHGFQSASERFKHDAIDAGSVGPIDHSDLLRPPRQGVASQSFQRQRGKGPPLPVIMIAIDRRYILGPPSA